MLIFKHSRTSVDHNGGHKSGLSFFKKKSVKMAEALMNEKRKKWATPLIQQTGERWRMAIQGPPRYPRVSTHWDEKPLFHSILVEPRDQKMTS